MTRENGDGGKKSAAKRNPFVQKVKEGDQQKERVKPSFSIEDKDEANLNASQRKLIEDIRAALDQDDKDRVLKLVNVLQTSNEWPDGIPKSIKMAALDALGWYGSSCLPEIIGFLADVDPELVAKATEKFQEALSDPELTDRELAAILIQASKVVTDTDMMDMMLFEMNRMRHSVAVETMKALMASDSETVKSVLPDNIQFYTGEEGIATPEQLDEWLKEYPDDENDEEFFGKR